MPLRKVTVSQTTTGTWAADTTIATALERIGFVTRLDLTAEITPSATLTAANQPDGLFRLIQNMSIRGGSHTYFNLPADDGAQGGTLLHYLNKADGHGIGHADGAIVAPTRVITPMNWTYHCGTRPRDLYGRDNRFDLSAFIPASKEGQLTAEWLTSGSDVMDDVVTITSAIMVYTIHRVMGDPSDIQAEMARQRVILPQEPGVSGMVPAWSATSYANAAATTDFEAETVNIPVGAWLSRIAVLEQDATATRTLRAGDELTRVAILVPGSNERLYQARNEYLTGHLEYGTALTADSGAAVNAAVATPIGADFNNAAPLGVYILDLRPMQADDVKSEYGLDLRFAATGDFRLGLYLLTRAAGDDSLIIWERYQVYGGEL